MNQKARCLSTRLHGHMSTWLRDHSGVAAVEFALFAPMLIFALLAMADVGLLVHQRMSLDHVLRVAAQIAAEDPGLPAIETALSSAVSGDGSGIATGNPIEFTVAKVCACAEAPALEVVCSTTCAGSEPTSIFYTMSSSLLIANLYVLPDTTLQPAIQVQIR